MCDAVKTDGEVCGRPVKVGGKCGIHKPKADPATFESDVEAEVARRLAAINIESKSEELLDAAAAADEKEDEEDLEEDEDEAVPAAGAGTPTKGKRLDK